MMLRSIALAAVAATSIGAQAALTTYAPWNAAFAGNGLSGVLFDVQSGGGATIALGAHAYKNSFFLPNDGQHTFYAQPGTYPGEPNRANWSFDFFVTPGSCTGCSVQLFVDTDPTAGVNPVRLFNLPVTQSGGNSWNMEMDFGGAAFAAVPGNALQGTYNFNPFAASSTAFSLVLRQGTQVLAQSDITVNVPEPGSLALAGLALAGIGALRRRKS